MDWNSTQRELRPVNESCDQTPASSSKGMEETEPREEGRAPPSPSPPREAANGGSDIWELGKCVEFF